MKSKVSSPFKLSLCLILASSTLVGHGAWAGGTNTGGTLRPTAAVEIQSWCRSSVGILEQARALSAIALIRGDFDGAFEKLEAAIRRALNRTESEKVSASISLSHAALIRGQEISAAIGELKQSGLIGSESAFRALDAYVDFLVSVVARIDLDFSVSYRVNQIRGESCSSCTDQWYQEFEKQYVRLARAQLQWLRTNFVRYSRATGAVPMGDTAVYLTFAELMTKYAADDLANPEFPWAIKYSCQIDRLRELNANIVARAFGDDRTSVNVIDSTIRSVVGETSESCGL